MIVSDVSSYRVLSDYPELLAPDCLTDGGMMGFGGDAFRCMVAEKLIQRDFSVLTTPDGPEEYSPIAVLRPALERCLAAGTVKFNKPVLRGVVAINYHRLAMATPQPGLGKPN